jgi:ABC-type antimicrobial peptide transport system permease subunit
MLGNYFKIIWRNLVKDRQFTILNLAGLSTGLACALLIWLWVADEMKMDKYNEKDAQIFQVMDNHPGENGIETEEYSSGLLAGALAAEMPEIEKSATVLPASWFSSKGIISLGDTKLKAGGQFISKDFFDIFSCRFIEGDKAKIFRGNNSIAISDELAMKLFHTTQNLIGKTIEWNQNEFNGNYMIVALFAKNPANLSEKYDLLFNFDLFAEKRPTIREWGNSDPHTFVLLRKGTNIAQFNHKINGFLKTKMKDVKRTLFVRKFSDKYLYGQYSNGMQNGGRIAYVKLFSIIAIFILAIACINFMNLSTAKASRRIKEVGIKKVMGAGRGSLIIQYLGESVLMSLLSLLLSIILIVLLLPAFNNITGKSLIFNFSGTLIVTILIITFITGLIAGSYPALYISSFNPVAVLKGKIKTSIGELWVRKGLVVFQFALSVIAIASVVIIYRQTSYIQSKNLGYSRDNVVDFPIPFELDSAKLATSLTFINELKNMPGIVSAGSYYHNLNGDHGSIGGFQWPGKDASKPDIDFANLEIGYGFMETVGIKMKEGHGFSNSSNTNKEIIFNESAIQQMGLKDPIGKTVKFWDQQRQIVGIAEDFNFESLYSKIKPCFFQAYPSMPNVIVKIKGGAEKQTIDKIQKLYSSFYKGLAFDYRFIDEEYQALYTSENRVAVLSKYFAGLAIIISCLGLFGLAAFSAQRRQKEIGIRKVIGASAGDVTVMLSKDFLRLVLIAIAAAFPFVWWTMNNWLDKFAYRVHIGADVFLLTGISVLLITILTISSQAIKAAIANPVKSLRIE